MFKCVNALYYASRLYRVSTSCTRWSVVCRWLLRKRRLHWSVGTESLAARSGTALYPPLPLHHSLPLPPPPSTPYSHLHYTVYSSDINLPSSPDPLWTLHTHAGILTLIAEVWEVTTIFFINSIIFLASCTWNNKIFSYPFFPGWIFCLKNDGTN